MRKTSLATLLAFLSLSTPASAQSSEIMDRVIGATSITLSQGTYLVFVASGKLAEDSSTDQAAILLQSLGWFAGSDKTDRPLKIAEYAYLLEKSFGLSTGFLEALFPGPRYAYRDLVGRGVIPGNGDPDELVTGPDAVRILGNVMDALPQGSRS